MEAMMRDVLLQCSGLAAIAVAAIHGVIGEFKVFPRMSIEPQRLRTLIRLVWQAGTVAWIGGAVLLIAAPSFGSESARHWIVVTGGVLLVAAPWMQSEYARHWIVITLACVFAFAALANAWATRGRHFGWMALSAVVVMAVAGY
jgi:hypothetical protein